MHGVVWHLTSNGWQEIWLECHHGRLSAFELEALPGNVRQPSIPVELGNTFRSELKLGADARVVDRLFTSEPPAPARFGLVLVRSDLELSFSVASMDLLLQWKRAIEGEGYDVNAVYESLAQRNADLQKRLTNTCDDPARQTSHALGAQNEKARTSQSVRPSIRLADTVTEEKGGDSNPYIALENHDTRGAQLRIKYEDTVVQVTFGSNSDLESTTLNELKQSACIAINETEKYGQLLFPDGIDIYMGNAPLRDYWLCGECGIWPGSTLNMHDRGYTNIEKGDNTGDTLRAPKLKLQVDVDRRPRYLSIYDKQDPEEAISEFVAQYGLSNADRRAIANQAYRSLARLLRKERDASKAHVAELRQKLVADSTSGATREAYKYEKLLAQAAEKIRKVEEERSKLSDELFELRLRRAEVYTRR